MELPPAESGSGDSPVQSLPPQVSRLAFRERQVATLVYVRGASTAKEIEAELVPPICNGAVRSMLVRLVHKGILTRRWGSRGRGREFVYLPSLCTAEVKRKAVQHVADLYFDGSLIRAVVGILELIESQSTASGNSRLEEAASTTGQDSQPQDTLAA